MVGAGILMILLAFYGLYAVKTGKLSSQTFYLKIMLLAIALPYLANISGWMVAEIGRQPWIVQGLMTVEAGISPNVSAGALLTTLVGFTLIYGVLAVVDLYLLGKYAKLGPEEVPWEKRIQPKGEVSLWT